MKKFLFLAVALFSVGSLMAQTEVIAHRGFHAKQGANSANNTISSLQHALYRALRILSNTSNAERFCTEGKANHHMLDVTAEAEEAEETAEQE